MIVTIRQERPQDQEAVFAVIAAAFQDEAMSDQQEPYLVGRLRRSDAFIPALSLVAEADGQLVGHILLTPVEIKNQQQSFASLALAPVSVLPEFQGKGIGGMLIRESHAVARQLGFQSVLVLGHETYYPKFGYEQADTYGITFPFDAPHKNCLVIALAENGLEGVNGQVIYPPEFFM